MCERGVGEAFAGSGGSLVDRDVEINDLVNCSIVAGLLLA